MAYITDFSNSVSFPVLSQPLTWVDDVVTATTAAFDKERSGEKVILVVTEFHEQSLLRSPTAHNGERN